MQTNFLRAHFSGGTQLEKSRSKTSRHYWIPTPAEYDTYGSQTGEYSPQAWLVYKLVWYTVKPVLSDHIKQDIFLAFQTGGCLLLHESTAGAFCATFIQQ